jgi:hypothetical protein
MFSYREKWRDCAEQYMKIRQSEHGFGADDIEFLDLSCIITPHLY